MKPHELPPSRIPAVPTLAILGAVLLALGLFLVMPLTQAVHGVPTDVLTHREVVVLPPPPDPPVLEDPEVSEALTEVVVELQADPPPLELRPLELSLNPGMGEALAMGIQAGGFEMAIDTVAAIQDIFDFDDLAHPPELLNARQIRLQFPQELVRRGVQEVKVMVQVLIDEKGRTRAEKILSSSYDHASVEREARRAVAQARFSITKVEGRSVQVRARFPLTLKAPRRR